MQILFSISENVNTGKNLLFHLVIFGRQKLSSSLSENNFMLVFLDLYALF